MNLFRRALFNLWYFGKPPWDRGISPPELLEYILEHPAGRAIDLGCGTGTNLITLATAGWQVTGVDFADRAIRLARRKLRNAGVQADLHTSDVTNLLDIHGPFDLALDMGCFHGVDNKRVYLEELSRVLAPRGSWLLYGFFKPRSEDSGPGLVEADLTLAQACLSLTWRRDGLDSRGRRSAWFLFQRIR